MSTTTYIKAPPSEDGRMMCVSGRLQIAEWLGAQGWFYESNADDEIYVKTPMGTRCAKTGDLIIKDADCNFHVIYAKDMNDGTNNCLYIRSVA